METTTNNVLAFSAALAAGHNPREYSYHPEDVPTGEYHVILDYMIWANKVSGVDLFCTVSQTGQRIRLTIFRDNDEAYKLGDIDALQLEYGSKLNLQVELNGRKKPVLHQIGIISAPENV